MERDAPVRPVQQHRHNLALVARLAARLGPVSRARLAHESGLTKSTVTQLTGELLDGGLLREIGTGRSGGPGRPANQLVLNSLGPAGIGLQIEADHVAGCLLDLTGRVRDRALRKADDLTGDPQRAVKAAEPVLRRLLNTANSTDNVVVGVAVGLPARVRDATVVHADGLGWADTNFPWLLGDRLSALGAGGIPVTVANSHQLAARAEHWFGGDEAEVLVHVGGEDGLGAGIVIAGEVHAGARGAAGELGHVRIPGADDPCTCGQRGCLDTVAGRRALLRAAGLDEVVRSRLTGGDGELPALVGSGEAVAVAAVRRAATALGTVLGGLVPALDPDVLVLGGHLPALGSDFLDAVDLSLRQRCPGAAVRVRASRLPADVVARAAATTVTSALIEAPADWLAE
ncbi:ROK family protein [Prauserella cavernicola]|uniref:ROK family protein n=1 Tax=Prauserella cavernicola TaxID=2800127 RepID=A0A934QX56_9PSEU|nr:ROK family protein [Prauserella cavernicola]MBK1788295.1 ROK family protein [Prauserella cavernicola]